jgi:hypothetical protein
MKKFLGIQQFKKISFHVIPLPDPPFSCVHILGMEAILRLAVPLISHDEQESLPEDMLGTPVHLFVYFKC